MANNTTELLYKLPEANGTVAGHLLGYPNQVSGGFFGPEILGLTFGGVFLTFLAGQVGPRIAILSAGFATWVVSLLLYGVTLVSNLELITEYQVIVTSTILLIGLIVTWTGGR